MVLLGLLLAAVAIVLAVGLALQPGEQATTVHFFGLNLPNLNGRTLILIGVGIGMLFMVGLTFARWGVAAARRRRRARKVQKAALADARRDTVEPEADQRDADRDGVHRQEEASWERAEAARREQADREEEVAAWERAEAARRDEAARHEEAALRQRAEAARRDEAARHEEAALRQRAEARQADHYGADPYAPDPYSQATSGRRPAEPYRGDTHPTDAYPRVEPHPTDPYPAVDPHSPTEVYPTVDPYSERTDSRPSGTVYQAGGRPYPAADNDQYGPPPAPYPPS